MRLIEVKNRDPSNGSADLVYKITRVYKNKNLREGERFVIRDNPQGSACGLPTTKGKRYGLRLNRTVTGGSGRTLRRAQPARAPSRRPEERQRANGEFRGVRSGFVRVRLSGAP